MWVNILTGRPVRDTDRPELALQQQAGKGWEAVYAAACNNYILPVGAVNV